jgi:hypothetical protein
MNPFSATMKNNSKMKNQKTDAKKKTRAKPFCYIYLTIALVKRNESLVCST